ncbi:filamentous hemagglutinin N-terminal domain-containing protein [Lusitaniella coriacea LEGE 07157]|uniref:Filamentous hemagglutinin N-terminal domain-containing protein n=1 Tax=Lusitaniella coriacea LEGE 07157 TaxID=945747 RepID=A0A8J7E3M1_9CYAN|nr:filamentous hemagglutinin N-terminal domain-containing protein [Lusitaniella coriacea]MBE9118079.1 filamentous hemagglutinin N-terminal domain-containing protein [Lusitaniella coriacea LEGE 07157]
MVQKPVGKRTWVHLCLLGSVLFGFGSRRAVAQILPDNTLGNESSTLTPNATITGGATRGSNLFHSFSEFNINNGQSVYFTNPTGIANILTRVTGGNPSNILGTLGVNGTANLFLLNPNGIFFGPNSQLDIRGSFIATTADSILFDNGFVFSAANPQNPSLLTVSVPLGLQYGTNNTGIITNRGNLAVGGNLTLNATQLDLQGTLQSGGDLTLQGTDTVTIRDTTTTPFIAAAGGKLVVQGNQFLDIFALNHPDSGFFSGGEMVLRSDDAVSGDAYYWSGGNFRIEQLDGNLGDLYSPYDPIILAGGDVSLGNYTGLSLHIIAGGSVTITGNIIITGADTLANSLQETVTLSNGNTVTIDGNARPTLDIRAGTTAVGAPLGCTGCPPTPAGLMLGGVPNSADITIDGNISITQPDGLVLFTNNDRSNGLAGNINVNGSIRTSSGAGNSGDVYVDSRGNLTFAGNGSIDSSVFFPTGTGGNITLLSQGNISLENPNNTILSTTTGDGKAGDININARSILLSGSSRISTFTFGGGQGGDVNIIASDLVRLVGNPPNSPTDDSAIIAATNGSGNSGSVTIKTKRFIAQDGGFIFTRTLNSGRGGDTTIIADDSVEIFGAPVRDRESGLFAGSQGDGVAGDIRIETGRLLVKEGGQVANDNSRGTLGSSGNITISARDSVEVISVPPYVGGKPTGIFTFTLNDRDAGDLRIDTKRFVVRDGASISTTTTEGAGNAGDLILNASESIQISGVSPVEPNRLSRVRTLTTTSGEAGNLTLTTGKLLVETGGFISAATSSTGSAGTLTVNATDLIEVVGVSTDGQNQSQLFFDSSGTGAAGVLNINTGRLQVRDGGKVSAATSGAGSGGLLQVNAADSVQVTGSSADGQFVSSLFFDSSGAGNAGTLRINTDQLLVQNGGNVSAGTSASGQGGILEVNAFRSVEVVGTSANGQNQSRLFFDSSSTGDAGTLSIDTRQLLVRDGGLVSAGTSASGRGGFLEVNASDLVQISGSKGQFASRLFFDSRGAGDARGIAISTDRLTVENGGQVSVNGTGMGTAGNLRVAASSVLLDNQGKLQVTNTSGAGSIQISTGSLTVENQSEISVSGMGSGVSGNLEISADSIFLNNQGNLLAATESGEGGNIQLNVAKNILLRFNSNILTEARGVGNGGNIIIDAGGFVLAILPENSDVAATAIQGRGGNIFVTAKGIFGFSFPERLVRTPESDISVGSVLGINGATEIVVLDSPSDIPLPDRPGTPTLSEGCSGNRGSAEDGSARAEFYHTRRGGMPPNPRNMLVNNAIPAPWVELESVSTEGVEATGWVRLADGRIFLTAENSLQGGYPIACQISDFPRSR